MLNRDRDGNRKLSKAEFERKCRYEEMKAGLEDKGYAAEELTVGLVYANVMAFVLGLPVVFVMGAAFFLRNPEGFSTFSPHDSFAILIVFCVLVVIHELIHGLTWAVFAPSRWKSISFGFIWRYLTPYCNCNEALRKNEYILGAAMPTLILGILCGAISIFICSYIMFILSAVMVISGGGDMTIILKLLTFKNKSKDSLYVDHPYKPGLVVFVK